MNPHSAFKTVPFLLLCGNALAGTPIDQIVQGLHPFFANYGAHELQRQFRAGKIRSS